MPLFKITHILKSKIFGRPAGWTDVWYLTAADFAAAKISSEIIIDARVQGLHQDYSVDAERITDNVPTLPPPAARRTRHAALYEIDREGSLGPRNEAALPGEAALIRVGNADNTVFRNWILRGVPDRWWETDDDKIAKAELRQFLITMNGALQAAQAFMLHKNGNPAVYTPVAIAKMQYFRMTHRNTGRPFGLQRGRK